MVEPLVSLYIPTHGRPELVLRAVASALAQSYRHLEVMVVIDGHDPSTLAALGSFSGDPRLRIEMRPESGGACVARNHAIERVRGELVTGLDDDDELLPHHVSGLVRTFEGGACAYSCTSTVLRRRGIDWVRFRFDGEINLPDLCLQNLVGNQVLTRTEYLRNLGGFDPEMPAWQDYDLWLRLTERYGSGQHIDARTYIQNLDHGLERISSAERIEAAHKRFVQKHSHLLDETARASLDLLKHATSHKVFPLAKARHFMGHGLFTRTVSALVSDRFPSLRAPARRALTLLLPVRERWRPPRERGSSDVD